MLTYTQRLKRSIGSVHRMLALRPTKDIKAWALVSDRFLPSYVQNQRIEVLRTRVVATACIFSILALLWGIVDYFAFPRPIFLGLLAGRLIISWLFAVITIVAVSRQKTSTLVGLIACMVTLLTVFYFLCRPPDSAAYSYLGEIAFTSYSLMPLILFAGLGFFPITLSECAFLIAPLLLVFTIEASHITTTAPYFYTLNLGSIWIMVVLGGISVFTSLSQLRLLIQQMSLAANDTLTGCLSRKYGEQAIELMWNLSKRYNRNYAVAFVDLDLFKRVNDTFGHQQGDVVLTNAAISIKSRLRASDCIIRWGGEEFLIVFPDTDVTGAITVVNNLYDKGFGLRPDGNPQTVSIGIAERITDKAGNWDWRYLIRVADERMYLAKQSGRNRYVGPDMPENIISFKKA